jgi:hypothetical protein
MPVGDVDVLHLARVHQGLELAIGNGLDLLALDPPLLNEQDGEHGRDHIPGVELGLLVHRSRFLVGRQGAAEWRHGSASSLCNRSEAAAV